MRVYITKCIEKSYKMETMYVLIPEVEIVVMKYLLMSISHTT